jgi:hypothetical protein
MDRGMGVDVVRWRLSSASDDGKAIERRVYHKLGSDLDQRWDNWETTKFPRRRVCPTRPAVTSDARVRAGARDWYPSTTDVAISIPGYRFGSTLPQSDHQPGRPGPHLLPF